MKTITARYIFGLQGVIFGGLSTLFLVSPSYLNGPGRQAAGAPSALVRDLG